MASKADRFYFINFIGAANCCCQSANYLAECLKNYDYSNMKQMLSKMHRLEHDADTKKHEMTAALAKAFVTPIDREDLAVISQNIDEVADRIEEVLQRFYVDEIKVVTPEAITFAEKIVKCCELMQEMVAELSNFKKSQKLHSMILNLSHMEEECDKLYLESTLKARKQGKDALEVMSWREIYDHMEECADACEHVGDSIELIVMKNT